MGSYTRVVHFWTSENRHQKLYKYTIAVHSILQPFYLCRALNFLSHFYFDQLEKNAEHNLGLVLPDLVRNFVQGTKLAPLHAAEESEPLEWLRKGANQHFARDKRFHASAYFEETGKRMTSLIKPVFVDAGIPRYYFAAHVLTEMLIDRVLLKEEPTLGPDFYHDMELADTGITTQFLQKQGVIGVDAFHERFIRFKQAKYLLQYVNDDAMVYSLNRIYMFTKADSEWSSGQFASVRAVIPAAESVIFENLSELKKEML